MCPMDELPPSVFAKVEIYSHIYSLNKRKNLELQISFGDCNPYIFWYLRILLFSAELTPRPRTPAEGVCTLKFHGDTRVRRAAVIVEKVIASCYIQGLTLHGQIDCYDLREV